MISAEAATALRKSYFNWLCELVGEQACESYSHLLSCLFSRLFYAHPSVPMDWNRALDGVVLRREFAQSGRVPYSYDEVCDVLGGFKPAETCSIFEMMVALASRCESQIMTNPDEGDRTGQWFWGMVVSLGLGTMDDERYDQEYVDQVIFDFLERNYAPSGRGGLFTTADPHTDMASLEIWYQMQHYLLDISAS